MERSKISLGTVIIRWTLVGLCLITLVFGTLIVVAQVENVQGEKLVQAAAAGDTQTVRKLVKSGAPVDFDFEGETPLMFAATNGHLETVEALLDLGADPNVSVKQSGGREWTDDVKDPGVRAALRQWTRLSK